MTAAQERVLEAVKRLSKRGYAPSVREIQADCGYASPENVHRHLVNLRALGRVAWEPNCPRTLRVLNGRSVD